jgi:fluoride exporter
MLNNLFLVVLGGGLGAGLRFLAGTYVTRLYSGTFPLGTFLINVTGSFLIGILMTLFLNRPGFSPAWRLFLVTGVLGGYTTFSSFEWETLASLKGGAPLVALLNVILSVSLGFAGVWMGAFLMSRARGH